jgi:hypothetical protein
MLLIVALTLAGGVAVAAMDLRPEALATWQAYVAATEHRRARESRDRDRFLALDFTDTAAADRRQVMDGQVVITQVDDVTRGRPDVEVRSAKVHHWRGAVLVRGLTVDALLASLEQSPPPQDDVLRAHVLARGPDSMDVYLRLRRSRFMTVVYDTEHRVTFERLGPGRAASATVATRIVEVDAPGTADERPLAAGEDHGFLWRLHAYWRYEAVDDGVIAECESLALSRPVPFGLGLIAGPIINGTAHGSMEAALGAVAALGTVSTPR